MLYHIAIRFHFKYLLDKSAMFVSLCHGTESTDRYHIVESVFVQTLILSPDPLDVQVYGYKLVEQVRLA